MPLNNDRRSPESIYNPRTRQELEGKQNRTRSVPRLPDLATEGDTVLVGGDLFVYTEGGWESITKPLRDRIAVLEAGLSGETQTLREYTSVLQRVGRESAGTDQRTIVIQHTNRQRASVLSNTFYPSDRPRIGPQEQRMLSPLERELIRFVFRDVSPLSPHTTSLCIQTVITDDGANTDFAGRYYHTPNLISMNLEWYPHTQPMGPNTTINDIDPVNMQNLLYMGTFVHEAVHHWQDLVNYENIFPSQDLGYTFDSSDLDGEFHTIREFDHEGTGVAHSFLGEEQHASAVEVWFLVAWQLEHTPQPTDGSVRMIDTTGFNKWDGIWAFDRYEDLKENFQYRNVEYPFDDGNAVVELPKRFITETEAMELLEDFEDIIARLRNPFTPTVYDEKFTPPSP